MLLCYFLIYFLHLSVDHARHPTRAQGMLGSILVLSYCFLSFEGVFVKEQT